MKAYTITNTVNGKKYVGITTCPLAKRMREHKSEATRGSNKPLYKAIRKYGIDAFVMEQVDQATSIEELRQIEIDLIAALGTYSPHGGGYNMTLGGEGLGNAGARKGEASVNAKLTEDIVAFIRHQNNAPYSNDTLVGMVADKFGVHVSRDCLRDARRGDTWRHVDVEYPPVRATQGSRKAPMTSAQKEANTAQLTKIRDEAILKSAELRRGQRGANAKLSDTTVKDIFFSADSLKKTALNFGISKKMVLLIKQRKVYKYITETL